ncbi:MAG: hypothetical protein ABJB10_17725 [Mesorhizobium sp.]
MKTVTGFKRTMRGDIFPLLMLAALASWAIVRVFSTLVEHSPTADRIAGTLLFIVIAVWFLGGVYGVIFAVVWVLR